MNARPRSITKRLDEILDGTGAEIRRGSPETPVAAIAEDSRRVSARALFVARRGTVTDGARYVDAAVAAGATAVLTARDADVPAAAAHVVADDVGAAAARIAERFFGDPSTHLRLVGVTGTNGKTTVATLLHQILDAAGTRTGLIGTVEVDDGSGERRPAELTTPPAIEISRLLATMVERGCGACAMEVSSHALAQRRTAGLRFAGAIFTNLSGDHLDYHETMDAYRDAKAELLRAVPADGWAIVNTDDDAARTMIDACACPVLSARVDGDADVTATIDASTIDGTAVRFTGPWDGERGARLTFAAQLPLVGRHNVANALLAVAAAHRLGVSIETIASALAALRAPAGRLEPVAVDDGSGGVRVFVDYAHTDDALENVLSALRPLVPGRLVTVFGCGGDRDRTKRPRMARAAWRWSDAVVVTSDNPRTEDAAAIVDEVMAGVPAARRTATTSLVDRGEAIHHAIAMAEPKDVVLIAGKGHEDYQIVGTTKRFFDDRIVAATALRERGDR